MVWIQYTLGIKIVRMLMLVLLCTGLSSFSQNENFVLQLSRDPASVMKTNKFYILNVADERKLKGAVIGRVVIFGSEKTAVLPSAVEKELQSYWSYSAPKRESNYLPLYINIKDLHITEKKVAPNRISGEMRLAVTFRWYRDMVPVELTNYESSASYTRPESDYDHTRLLRQLMDQSLVHFNKWMIANAGKTPALARGLQLVFKEIVHTGQADTVFYNPNRPLTWDDFTGKSSKPGTRYAAAVFTSFAYEGNSYPKDNNLVVELGLKIFMVKSMSWGRSESRDSGTLRHEQIHFDITRMVVERFKERLKKAELTVEDFDSEIQYQFLEAFREMNNEQEKYDGETGHGVNGGAQSQWDRKIRTEIARIYSVQ